VGEKERIRPSTQGGRRNVAGAGIRREKPLDGMRKGGPDGREKKIKEY